MNACEVLVPQMNCPPISLQCAAIPQSTSSTPYSLLISMQHVFLSSNQYADTIYCIWVIDEYGF